MKDYLIVGSWIITIYLSFATFKRSELYKSKDKIVDRLDKLQEWIAKELKSIKDSDSSEEKIKTLELIENYSASKMTQIELRIEQLNIYSKKQIFNTEKIALVRNIDLFSDKGINHILKSVNKEYSDLIEYIEIQFESHTSNKLSDHIAVYWREFLVLLATLGSIYLILIILQYFFG